MLSNSDSIALASATISACALGLTVWQGLLQRRHAILNIRPYFVVTRDARNEGRRLVLANTGLGPGSFVYIHLLYNEITYNINDADDRHKLSEKLQSHFKTLLVRVNSPGKGHFLNVGWRESIVELPLGELSSDMQTAALDFLNKAKIDAQYECLYGIKYTY